MAVNKMSDRKNTGSLICVIELKKIETSYKIKQESKNISMELRLLHASMSFGTVIRWCAMMNESKVALHTNKNIRYFF